MSPVPDLDLPSDVGAERTLLGAVLLDGEAWDEVALVPKEAWSLDSHLRIRMAMKRLAASGTAIDIVTLASHLSGRHEIEAIGGVAYLASLTEGLPRRPAIADYIKIVNDKSVLRRLMIVCSQTTQRAADQSETGLEVLGALQSQLEAIGSAKTETEKAAVEQFIVRVADEIESEYQTKLAPYIPTGNAWLDSKMGGYRCGKYTIGAARPKVGKTGNALRSVAYNCVRGLHNVVFSLEMEKKEIIQNLVPYVVDLPNIVVSRPWLQTPEQHLLVMQALSTITEWPLEIYDGAMDCDEVCWTIRRTAKRIPKCLYTLDHFGLMQSSERDIRKRYVENSDRLMKEMKMHKESALHALFQLNEVAREYADKRPVVGDIGESKKPLQDCYAMVMFHRYMDKETLKMTKKANINLALIRGGGSPGNIDCDFNSHRLCFDAEAELEYDTEWHQ